MFSGTPPGVAPVGKRPKPHEPDSAEPIGAVEAPGAEPLLTAGQVADPGRKDRDPIAASHEQPGEIVVARPGRCRPVRSHGVVVDDPHPSAPA